MLRFSDLDKKGAKKEAEPDSSVLEDLSQEQEESIKFDPKDWYERQKIVTIPHIHCARDLAH